ncbi:MAG: integration host factor subunit beta [Candidatus Sumerlaeota bacterium]|nr:integration host factor subunit beta [Candidatus Sumerlaeota bacterium]
MIKVHIVKEVAAALNLKDKEALQIVDAIVDAMKDVISENRRLEVRDFGVFQVKQRKARIGRNPRNKEQYPIPPRKVVTFKLGKELKDHAVDPDEGYEGAAAAPRPAPADNAPAGA